MKIYEGKREGHAVQVTVNGRPLNPRLDLWNHSPSGFEWGYGGSGPAQLALALLADCLEDDEKAIDLHQAFKFAVVTKLAWLHWRLTDEHIRQVLTSVEMERLCS